MKAKRIIIACVLILCVLLSALALFACDDKDGKQKNDKAIIYVTALFGGGL